MVMDVPEGYKQTEVGVIPEDWAVLSMGEITTLMTNGFVGTAKTHYTDEDTGVTYIQGYNIEENSFNFNGIKKVTQDFHKNHKKSCLEFGDILTVQTGDVGLTSVVPKELVGSNCHALIISRVKRKQYDPFYISYYFNSNQGQLRLSELEIGTTMKHINVGDLLHFEVPLPTDKHEQTAIATTLSDVDNLITSLKTLIHKKRQIKTATMQRLLTGKQRLPGFGEGKGMQQTELGEIPEDWEFTDIDNVTTKVGSGITPRGGSNVYSLSGRPFARSQNIGWGHLILDDLVYIDEKIHRTFLGSELKTNDVLLNITGASIGRSAIADCRLAGGNVNQHVCIIRVIDNIVLPELVNYFILSQNGQSQIASFQSGGNREGLNFKQIRSMAFPISKNTDEQKEIVATIKSIDNDITTLETHLSKTQSLKQGMMQELLTGRTRLI